MNSCPNVCITELNDDDDDDELLKQRRYRSAIKTKVEVEVHIIINEYVKETVQ
jgi:hypothetical protein